MTKLAEQQNVPEGTIPKRDSTGHTSHLEVEKSPVAVAVVGVGSPVDSVGI